MKGTTNAQRNAVVDSTSAVDSLTLTKADGTTQKHTVSNIIPKDDAPTSGSSKFVTSGAIYTALQGRVPVESGKGLSTNDYTTAEKSKVSNLPDNANNTFATKTELTNAVSSVYKYKGTKATYSALPTSGNTTGDVWNVTAANGNIPAGTNYAWNGSAWDALGGEIDLSGYVPTSRTVNGKALTGNITLAAADVSAVPTTRTVNGKALSANITLSAADVGALATSGTAAKATADASGNVITDTYATKSALTTGLAGKQNALTFDSAPTSGSSNPVTSGGVYSAINGLNNSISSLQSTVAGKQDKLPLGQEGQVWTSDGEGQGKWADAHMGEVSIEDYLIPLDASRNSHQVTFNSNIGAVCTTRQVSQRYSYVFTEGDISNALYYDPDNNKLKRCSIQKLPRFSSTSVLGSTVYMANSSTDEFETTIKEKLSYIIGGICKEITRDNNGNVTSDNYKPTTIYMKLGTKYEVQLTSVNYDSDGRITDFAFGAFRSTTQGTNILSGTYDCEMMYTYDTAPVFVDEWNYNKLPSSYIKILDI